ncbi:MAG: PQQ-like beta-propeller repeat protein [Polyangiaceae bacterium]|nr:PQQ-like beta-propeller repeat protein [Polyangiaceae bacterium]
MRALAMAVGAVILGTTLAAPGAPLTPKVAHGAPQLRPTLPVWDSPQKPVLLDVNGDGTEDVIGIRRIEPDSPNAVRSYFLVAVDGETFETLWGTRPTPERLGAVVACAGQLFITSNDKAVAIIDSRTGKRGPIPAGEVLDLPGSPSCPLGDFCVEGDNRSCTPRPPTIEDPAKAGFGRAPLLRRHRDDAVALGSGQPDLAVGEGDGDYLFGFDPETFKIRWKEKVGDAGGAFGSTQRHHEVAFGRSLSHIPGHDGPTVVARDAKTGRELWTRRVPNADAGRGFNGFVASPTRIYVLGEGRVEVLVASSGEWIGTVK